MTFEVGGLVRSRHSGEAWTRVYLGETAPSHMFQIAIDRAAPSHVYCCTRDRQVYSICDGGDTWSRCQLPGEMSRTHHVYPMVCG